MAIQTLSRDLRRSLENTIREARRAAEAGARKALEQLAVHHHEPWPSMNPDQRALRNRLRAHGRQLGDRRDEQRGVQAIDRLTTECAYEHWHRMLFARFLAEADLLIEPQSGMAVSLAECQELAREQGRDWLELAVDFAQRMLPQIFRAGDPVLEVVLPPETRSKLEDLMKGLSAEVFAADDSLGWVYQYWQAERKEEVNRSEKKIGADELPAVTQLFTEDYMVLFLLHNTLGAWWAGRVLAANPSLAESASSEDELRAACKVGDVDWTYLRFVRDEGKPWRPAAGTFDGWPKAAKGITVLDPCMGSGHFLVFALPILVAMRMQEESLSFGAAIEAVLRDNVFGLEIDPRCTQIAAFNLAFAAWRRIGYKQLPALHLACSGLALGVTKAEWLRLAERAAQALQVPAKPDHLGTEDNLFSDATKRGFERLYDLFVRAPWLGSLIDPRAAGGDLVERGFAELEPALAKLMAKTESAELSEMAIAASGLAKAADILAQHFTLVATNVPYLGRGKQDEVLKDFCDESYPESKAGLATVFIERCLVFAAPGGSTILVTPENWLALGSYKKLRGRLLQDSEWNFLVRLGPRAFQTPMWDFNTVLIGLTKRPIREERALCGIDLTEVRAAEQKAAAVPTSECLLVCQLAQLTNPDARIGLSIQGSENLLSQWASSFTGLGTGDFSHYGRYFWEFPTHGDAWAFYQTTVETPIEWGGREHVIAWDVATQRVRGMLPEEREQIHNQDQSGQQAWNKRGVAIGLMGELKATIYTGEKFDKALAAIIPDDPTMLPALWAFCSDPAFSGAVRQLDENLFVANGILVKIPFDVAHWTAIAAERFPNGLPRPTSSDATQWLFGGHPKQSMQPLHVAMARLLGYNWPRQTGCSFWECPALGVDDLQVHADPDGIVTLTSVKGAQSATSRLIALLSDAFSTDWSAAKLAALLAQVGFAGRSLEEWLRDGCFEQHCILFRQRPFLWHVSDGRRDGFHAFVNYHRLAASKGEGRRVFEKLIYSYLGDWIDGQRANQRAGVEGADARVASAQHLKSELTKILNGEPPYDIFARWKPIYEQPLGWEPDINDGVRVNIRPFMMAKPLNARGKGTCVLRVTPKIKWEKDRGKQPNHPREDFPWFWGWDEQAVDFEGGKTFDGNRWNDLHYTRKFKQAARSLRKK